MALPRKTASVRSETVTVFAGTTTFTEKRYPFPERDSSFLQEWRPFLEKRRPCRPEQTPLLRMTIFPREAETIPAPTCVEDYVRVAPWRLRADIDTDEVPPTRSVENLELSCRGQVEPGTLGRLAGERNPSLPVRPIRRQTWKTLPTLLATTPTPGVCSPRSPGDDHSRYGGVNDIQM
jgi:hypothetical protein